MGIMNWFARKGNIGGTARAVAKQYKIIRRDNPSATDQEIMREIARNRYSLLRSEKRMLISTQEIDQGRIKTLSNLAMLFLDIETKFGELDFEDQKNFAKIIYEELQAAGIPDALA